MQAYNYSAYDRQGKTQKGVLEGTSERMVRQLLREKKLIPVKVAPVRQSMSLFRMRERVSRNDLMLITRQLATLVGSGMPLEESLRLMAEQAENVVVKRLISNVRGQVTEGRSLAYALKNSPYSFSPDYVATISAGEETGHLQEVLERLADDVEVQGKARQSLMAALIYPFLMITVALTVIVLLIVYVVPQVTRVFLDMDQTLPVLTQGLIAVSDWLQAYGFYAFMFIFTLTVVFVLALRRPDLRFRWDSLMLRTPRLGYWVVLSNTSGWSRSLGMLLGSGVPILESMKIAAERVHNAALRKELSVVSERVREGDSLHKALAKAENFPPFLIHMVSSGESSGTLDNMLIKVADYYEQRLKTIIDATLKLFEPLLVIMMGGIVLLIVLAVLVPIIEMNQMI